MLSFTDQVVANHVSKSTTEFQSGLPLPSSGTPFDLLDPANARRAISGLSVGGIFGAAKQMPSIGFQGINSVGGPTAAGENDWRVRVSLGDNAQVLYKDPTLMPDSILAPLINTNGVIWPYTPSITVTHNANYTPQPLTHSNYTPQFYNNSDVNDITISGDFTVQSVDEGQYLMACIYFLRAATKMFFGQGQNVGNPPPMVFLDGYGSHYFPHVPCVITSFQHTLPNDVDYIPVPVAVSQVTTSVSEGQAPFRETYYRETSTPQRSGSTVAFVEEAGTTNFYGTPSGQVQETVSTIQTSTRLPTSSQIQVTLRPVYSRSNLHYRFNLNDFAQGRLIGDKTSGFGGFL